MAEKVVIGNAELWHGDCREVLPLLLKHDLLLTDPPYGIGVSNTKYGNGKRAMDVPQHDWDAAPPAAWLFGLMMERSAAQIVWGGNYFGLPASRCWLVWDKCTGANAFADCELAWTSLDAAVRKLAVPWVGANATDVGGDRPHPTLKPTRLMTWCLDKVPDAQTVLDPFMGSGTTGVACAQLGKAFTGIERERKYFDIACERISRAQAQGTLLPLEQTPAPTQQAMDL